VAGSSRQAEESEGEFVGHMMRPPVEYEMTRKMWEAASHEPAGRRTASPAAYGHDWGCHHHPTYHGRMTQPEKKVLLAAPRGYCAGVDRAVVTVEKALELYGPPVYVRKQIVHNKHVVSTLEKRGAIFVEETDEVPEGATVIFSAQPQDH
jgi:hypothetical protein